MAEKEPTSPTQRDPKEKTRSSSSNDNNKNKKSKTLSWHQIEPWRQTDNQYLKTGWRPLSSSYLSCLQSLSHLHNETINIYTHLLGLPLFLISGYHLYLSLGTKYTSPSYTDAIAFGSYFAGLTICLSLSSCYHVFASHSKEIHDRFLLFDFLGILSLITGSWIPGIYYGFYCRPFASKVYWSLICTLSTLTALTITHPTTRLPRYKPHRTTLFLLLGLSGILPLTTAALTFGIPLAHKQMGWGYIILEACFYLAGAVFYAARLPERVWPERFDFVGASHQFFHGFVLLGAAAHLRGLVLAFGFCHHPDTRVCEHFWG